MNKPNLLKRYIIYSEMIVLFNQKHIYTSGFCKALEQIILANSKDYLLYSDWLSLNQLPELYKRKPLEYHKGTWFWFKPGSHKKRIELLKEAIGDVLTAMNDDLNNY